MVVAVVGLGVMLERVSNLSLLFKPSYLLHNVTFIIATLKRGEYELSFPLNSPAFSFFEDLCPGNVSFLLIRLRGAMS